jgi:hypothetical protein
MGRRLASSALESISDASGLKTLLSDKHDQSGRPFVSSNQKRRESMSVGMILLALWLILQGLPLIVRFVIPNKVMGILALLAGILILIGR